MISQEIGDAITTMPLGEPMDEGDLEAELEGLEQEAMDERMLNTGPTPVGTRLEGLPAAGNTERKFTRHKPVSRDFRRKTYANDRQSTSHTQTRKKTRRPNWPSSRPKWQSSESSVLEY
jgi:hypothetical protein